MEKIRITYEKSGRALMRNLILIGQSHHPLVRYFLIFNVVHDIVVQYIRPFMRVTETDHSINIF